jgi:hypothetical protein
MPSDEITSDLRVLDVGEIARADVAISRSRHTTQLVIPLLSHQESRGDSLLSDPQLGSDRQHVSLNTLTPRYDSNAGPDTERYLCI